MKSKLVLILGLGFTIFQYQNCSSVPNELLNSRAHAGEPSIKPGLNQKSSQGQDQPGTVRAIDPISVGDILFPSNEVSLSDTEGGEELLSKIGLCGQNGSFVGWQIYAGADGDELIDNGLAPCDLGSFEINSTQDWSSYCGQNLKISASLGAKASAEVSVSFPCE